ncbi:hypothetical protein LCGC14_2288840, partial [marine sediment metagenome]
RDESIAQLRTGGLLGVDPEPMTSFWVPLCGLLGVDPEPMTSFWVPL